MARSGRYDRFVRESEENPWRPPAERDRDRLLYSTSFRRLAGVTQVAAPTETALIHNRLTHSLKVGQVGRKLATTINFLAASDAAIHKACVKFTPGKRGGGGGTDGPIDPWALEAAGMAHDLGHPPFGHIAENVLQKVLGITPNANESLKIPEGFVVADTFEGNAQTFRILTKLAFGRSGPHVDNVNGLNLTRSTLSSVSKYPWLREERPAGVDDLKEKWGAYNSERSTLDWCMGGINGKDNRQGRGRADGLLEFRSIEAQAMDWADDITYAIHDLEDFSRAGLMPLSELRSANAGEALFDRFKDYCVVRLKDNPAILARLSSEGSEPEEYLGRTFIDVISSLPPSTQSTRQQRENFREWSSSNIDLMTGPESITVNSDGVMEIAIESLIWVEILKKLTWYFIIDRPAVASAQRGQARLVRELYVWLLEWTNEAYDGIPRKGQARISYSLKGLPPRLIDYLDLSASQTPAEGGYRHENQVKARAVSDFIASLTEQQTVEFHARLGGVNGSSMLDASFQI